MEMRNFFNRFVKLSNKKRFVETLLFTFALPLVLALPAEEEECGGGGREHRVALASSYSRLKTEATALYKKKDLCTSLEMEENLLT